MAIATAHVAHAQDVSASPVTGTQFDRFRTVSVASRVQAGYEELGTRSSGFVFYPRVRAQVTYDDNVRAGSSNRDDDVAFTVEPSIRAVSEWSRHQVGLAASANMTRFARLSSENFETYVVRGQGRYDAGDEVRIFGDVGYRRDVERRSAPGALRNTLKPVAYRTASANGQATWQGNRLRLAASASAAKIHYEDVAIGNGLVIDSRQLDRSRYQGGVRADYAVTANLAVLVSASVSKLNYNAIASGLAPDRTARRAEVLAGASFEFTDLLRGEVAVGYIQQNFRSAAIRNFSGLGGRAELEYFPTRLTTVRLDASRTLQDAGNPLAPSYRRTHIGLRIDHELYRYVLLSGFANYETDRFQLPSRTERRRHVGASTQYLVDRHVTLFARYDHLRVNSRPAALGRRLVDNAFTVGVLFKP